MVVLATSQGDDSVGGSALPLEGVVLQQGDDRTPVAVEVKADSAAEICVPLSRVGRKGRMPEGAIMNRGG